MFKQSLSANPSSAVPSPVFPAVVGAGCGGPRFFCTTFSGRTGRGGSGGHFAQDAVAGGQLQIQAREKLGHAALGARHGDC